METTGNTAMEGQDNWAFFTIRLKPLLRYLESEGFQPIVPGYGHDGATVQSADPIDWHLILRQGLGHRLHINLGIPGVEEPESPIEENHAALYAAMILEMDSLEVILSGELELAVEAGLITEKALGNLRNQIRVSD